MKKFLTSLAIPLTILSTNTFACDDFSGKWVGSCANIPVSEAQVRAFVSQEGCGNVQVMLDTITKVPIPNPGLPIGYKVNLRSFDMHPSLSAPGLLESFLRDQGDTTTSVIERLSFWKDGNTKLDVTETTKSLDANDDVIPGSESILKGHFFLSNNGQAFNLDIFDDSGSGDCKLYRTP